MHKFFELMEILYINISVTYASLVFVYFLLSSDRPLNFCSPLSKRVLFGLLCGGVSLYLNNDKFSLSDHVYYSFEMIPLVVCLFYVGWLSMLCGFLLNFFFSGMFTVDKLFVGLMLAGICYFRPWKDNNIRTFGVAITIVVTLRLLASLPFLTTRPVIWQSLVYQGITLMCMFICYHGLGGKFKYVQNFFQTKESSSLDFLTKAYNRMGLEEHLKRVKKGSPQVGLAMLDIDFFKQVNDNYGHPVGDAVLVRVAEVIRMMIRKEDVLARFGGEEFVILFSSDNIYQMVKSCERIRQAIAKTPFAATDGTPFSITVSLGVTRYQKGKNLQENIIVADKALYLSKTHGRNKTTSI